jgi:two-component system sensor histidine kinase UhpB
MSLRFRVNLAVSSLMLVFCALLGGAMLGILRESVKEEMEASTKVANKMLATFAARVGARHPDGLIESVVALGRVRSHDLVIEDAAGVFYRSPGPEYKRDRQAPAWFAQLMMPESVPVPIAVGPYRITLLPDASRAVLDAWDDGLRLSLMLLGLLAGLHLLLHWLVGRALTPVDRIVAALREMEEGNLAARLPGFASTEFARIGNGFNRMAGALEVSRSENDRLEENQRVARLVQERLESERKVLARELHDELGQSLTAIRAIATSVSNRSRDLLPEVHGSAQTIVSLAGQVYDGVHALINRLRPAALIGVALGECLQNHVRQWRASHAAVELEFRVGGDLDSLGEAVQIALLRVVQESLTNVARHACASRASLQIERGAGQVTVRVEDNGRGHGSAALPAGRFGLLGMKERVQALGGSLEVITAPGEGFRLTASIPVREEKMEEAVSCR